MAKAKKSKLSQSQVELKNRFRCAACGRIAMRGRLIPFETAPLGQMIVKVCKTCVGRVSYFDIFDGECSAPEIVTLIHSFWKPKESK